MTSSEEIIELIPAYILDTLDEADKALVEQYLADYQAVEAELRAYQVVAAQLPLAAPEATPSPTLKDRLMQRLQLDAPVPPVPSAQPALARKPFWDKLRLGPVSVWAGIALLLIIILAASNLLLWRQVNSTSAPDLHIVTLSGTESAPDATGIIVITKDGQRGRLVVDHMPPLNPGTQYQLWLVKDNQRTSGVVFPVSPTGFWSGNIEAPESLINYPTFDISIEPEGGSSYLTGDRILDGQFQNNPF